MSMSMFSSFDALCAESFFGQKTGLFRGPLPSGGDADGKTSELKIGVVKKGKEVNSSPPQQEKRTEDCRRVRAARFAPELDGVHCFETIVPY
ncbi:Unknown protein [Striga hermonthica]|uniref:Uncharacterized protein n=1 Tax=Striga hermonthica TaxID=68872 RepID=A0A9N7R5G9_STRHE|nr:Unknown protein [Striga hermonthica]